MGPQNGTASRHGPVLEKALAQIEKEINGKKKKTKGARRQRGGKAKAKQHTLVGPKQFLIWVDNFLKFGPIGLLPRYQECGRHEPYYVAEERAILREFALDHLKPEPRSAEMIHGDMETAITALNVERAAATPPLPPQTPNRCRWVRSAASGS